MPIPIPLNINLENITVDGGAVTFTGSDSADSIFAQNIFVDGAINLNLKGGNDSVIFDNATIDGNFKVTGNYATLKNSSINGNITISGGNFDDTLIADNLTGNIWITGGEGNDSIIVGNIKGSGRINGGGGNDTVIASNITDGVVTIACNNDVIFIDRSNIYCYGDNSIIVGNENASIGDGISTIKTTANTNITVKAGFGANIIHWRDYTVHSAEGDSIITIGNQGNDVIKFADGWAGTINGVEKLQIS